MKHDPILQNSYDFVLTPREIEDTSLEVDKRNLIPSLSIHETQMVLDILGVQLYEERDELVDNISKKFEYNVSI